jgi:uncharacterized protein with PIN domain
MNIILDACAVIALAKDESGAEAVATHLLDDEHNCMIHCVNLCEVYYGFLRSDGEAFAQKVVSRLQQAGVSFRSDLTIAFWQQVARYKATIARIALADCFALTLAHREKGILVTSDRKEFEPLENLNLCAIEFIR